MSAVGAVSTARQDPSLIDMTNRWPCCMRTISCSHSPLANSLAPPTARLCMPLAMAANCSACSSGKSREEVRTRPSEETTTAWSTPGTSSTKFEMSQAKFSAVTVMLSFIGCLPASRLRSRYRRRRRGSRSLLGAAVAGGGALALDESVQVVADALGAVPRFLDRLSGLLGRHHALWRGMRGAAAGQPGGGDLVG